MYKTIAEIKKANDKIGEHWFDYDWMKYFRTTIYPEVYFGKWFITSEPLPRNKEQINREYDKENPRVFSIRLAHNTGEITTIGDLGGFASFEEAEEYLKEIVVGESK